MPKSAPVYDYRFVEPSFTGFPDRRPWTKFRPDCVVHAQMSPTIPASPDGDLHLISPKLYEEWRVTLDGRVAAALLAQKAAPASADCHVRADMAKSRAWTVERTMLIRFEVTAP